MADMLTLEYVPLDVAMLWDDNQKRHDIGMLIQSFERHGFKDPPKFEPTLNDGAGAFVEGNGRTEALDAMRRDGREPPRGIAEMEDGTWLVPVVFGVDADSEAAAAAYGIDHNQITLMGGDFTFYDSLRMWDADMEDQLTRLAHMGELPVSVAGDDIDALLALGSEPAGSDPGPQIDRAEELRRKWGVESNQLWRLGPHLIACGDCTDPEVVAGVMGGERAQCMWTDPPYGVEYVGKTSDALTIENDGADGLPGLLAAAFATADEVLVEGAAVYVAHPPGALFLEFGKAFVEAGWHLHETLVWVKDSMVLGHSDYHYQHEPILYGWKGKGRNWYGGRDKVSVFETPRPKRSSEHPTMKPVELVEACLRNSTRPGDVVWEPFCGSGSTLVACERVGAVCRAVDISPAYVAVTLERWSGISNKAPERLGPCVGREC